MASCRIGRIPLPSDPILAAHNISGLKKSCIPLGMWFGLMTFAVYLRTVYPHEVFQYKGPENPCDRPRRKKFPAGGCFFGWGNNGLNRDCSIYEYECWSGYVGKTYLY